MSCPHCNSSQSARKKGYFSRKSGVYARIPRYQCRDCRRTYSPQTGADRFEHRPELNRPILALHVSGVSQRRAAFLLKTSQQTIARKLTRIARRAQLIQKFRLESLKGSLHTVVFDEMETFEHSKCKPLAIAVAVVEKQRKIIAARVSQMPAKGRLSEVALKKYGYRADHRRRGLTRVLRDVADVVRAIDVTIKSDLCPRYPKLVKSILPGAKHLQYKGRRGCVVGQGELKAGGRDPLFSLNHTCAMFRDNLKRLSRRTWCTTKKASRLQMLVDIYVAVHNEVFTERKRRGRGQLGQYLLCEAQSLEVPQLMGIAQEKEADSCP